MHQHKLTFKFTLLFVLLSCICFGQHIMLKGIVKGINNENLDYVNIGIKSKDIGTISDKNGHFTIRLFKKHKSDSLTFSYLGYQQLTIKVSDIIKKDITTFILDEELISLDEVVVSLKKTKEKKLGTTSYMKFVVGDVRVDNQNNDIQEFAKQLNIKKPSQLTDVNIALSNIKIGSAKFRVNFYSIENDLPSKKIGSRNIIIEKNLTKLFF